MPRAVAFAALFAALALAPSAQSRSQNSGPKTVTKESTVTSIFTIAAIDQVTRSITLRSANGDEDTYIVGPQVTRLNQLKVGDRITAAYHESLLLQLRKPGEATATTGEITAGGRIKETPG